MSAKKPGSWSPIDRLRTSSTVVIVAALVLGAVVVPAAYGAGADLAGPDGERPPRPPTQPSTTPSEG